ncbi:unnamed protein product [Oncorhynchus mykiss]|uniref:Meckelin n=1 Tax=Oncorhynchus mykiss TaxID=8022 RepID=A0A060YQW9_ONCMY|nr:unnamed protein product [Oncorhynchus mykiss]
MATGMLLVCGLALFLTIKSNLLHSQQFTISFQRPSDCGVEQFYDISSQSCVKCGPNQSTSATGLSCECVTGFRVLATNGASITCQRCPLEKPAVTEDGYGCILCPGSLTEQGTCQCPSGSILVERDVQGNPLEEARCEVCNGAEPALSAPNSYGDRCQRCQASLINTSQSCMCGSNILAGGMCFPPNNLPTTVNPNVNYAELSLPVQSAWFSTNLYSSAAACLVYTNLTACQALGNMCVMNMHSFSSVANDACGLYNTIFRATAALGSTQDISYWRANLPWLYYGDQPGLANRVLQTEPLPTGFSFKGRNRNTDINLVAAVYNARGDFLQWEKVGGNNLQLCPDTARRQEAAYTFGTAYQETCVLSVADLLRVYAEPLFYDVFVDLSRGEDRRLLPLPTRNLNQEYNRKFINQGNLNDWYLSRRVLLVDTLSGREKSLGSLPKVIRIASSIRIGFQLVPGTQKGQVFPPLLSVTYSDVLITAPNTQTVSVSFAVDYEMDQTEAHMKTDIALGVLGGVSVLYSLVKTASWKRRIGSPLIDMETVLKFLLFYAGDLANVFFFITVGTGLYWLIFYKAQHFVSVLLPLPGLQEERFVAYVGCAFALKVRPSHPVDSLCYVYASICLKLWYSKSGERPLVWARGNCSGLQQVLTTGGITCCNVLKRAETSSSKILILFCFENCQENRAGVNIGESVETCSPTPLTIRMPRILIIYYFIKQILWRINYIFLTIVTQRSEHNININMHSQRITLGFYGENTSAEQSLVHGSVLLHNSVLFPEAHADLDSESKTFFCGKRNIFAFFILFIE